MNHGNTRGRTRFARRLIIGTLLGVGAAGAMSVSASAATTATFSNGVLTVFGDGSANTIEITRNGAGKIFINGGAVSIKGRPPTVTNTTQIQVYGHGGDDHLTLTETNGALPRATLFGGGGNDTLSAGSGGDQLFGQAGNDTLLGRAGPDTLFGGADNDVLTGGDGDDQVYGESGDDRMIWDPGDDTDLDEGGVGNDLVEVNGGGAAEAFTTTANGTRVRFDRLDPAPFSLDIGTAESLVVNGNDGNDSFSATGNLAALIKITVDGGGGDDTLLGSNGIDLLIGNAGNDVVDGQQGNDLAFLGAGDDRFQWDPGDGSDTIEGEDGADAMLFNGSNGAETFQASANGQRMLFTRNLGNIVMDVDGVEVVDLNTLGSADTVVVNDLSGTDVAQLDTDLAGAIGGTAGDGSVDTVILNATNGPDSVGVGGTGTAASVTGVPAPVNITNSEGANDALVVNTLGNDDTVTAATLPAGVIKLTIDGGADNDTLAGSPGADVLIGGDGHDVTVGDGGNDVALMGAGDDTFQWFPGDGNDTLEGQSGTDSTAFFGADDAENIDLAANAGRVLFFRDVDSVTADLDDIEDIDVRAFGGADNVSVGDLTGTDVIAVGADLSGADGGGDGAADLVTVTASQGDDVFAAAGDTDAVGVTGLQAAVTIASPEHTNDRLVLNALGGNDSVDATAVGADAMPLTINGGLGADALLGSDGSDLISGGDGTDTAFMGAGDDTFVWNPGDDNDTLDGQDGADTMLFNGANANENVTITASGDRALFFRDIANVTMDLDRVEDVNFRALGGADTITVNDLTGTDVTAVNTDLTGPAGGGDGQADNVIVQGTQADDTIAAVIGDPSGVSVLGLTTQININGSEVPNDRLTINALAGDDAVEGSGLAAGAILLTANGGDGADILIGSDGDDILTGGAGDDVLIGGLGNDVIDGGDGDDIEIQLVGSSDKVTSATAADNAWINKHVRIVNGKTVVDASGKQRTLHHTDLSRLTHDAASS